MGRFDALTHLEEERTTSATLPVAFSAAPKTLPAQPIKTKVDEKKKPEIMISRNHDTSTPTDRFKEKPSKYSTLLNAGLIKKIKLFAAEKEIKDYEVIELALTEYFNKQHNS
jgi:hypothetical protein